MTLKFMYLYDFSMRITFNLSYVSILISLFLGLSSQAFAFGPCLSDVPETVAYRPTLRECAGNAAVILSGDLKDSFSVVVRDAKNSDRDPRDLTCEFNWCSPFKVHKVIKDSDATIHCLGASGSSPLYDTVRRITIKVKNPVKDRNKDILKYCLNSRTNPLN